MRINFGRRRCNTDTATRRPQLELLENDVGRCAGEHVAPVVSCVAFADEH